MCFSQVFRIAIIGISMTLGVGTSYAQTNTSDGPKIVTGVWTVNCSPVGEDQKLICEASRTIALQQTGESLLTVFVSPWQQDGATEPFLMRLQLPHGLDLPKGVQIKVDEGSAGTATFQTTTPTNVFARLGLSDGLIGSLKKGKIMSVSFSGINGNQISIPVPLNGFTAVFAKLK